MTPGFPFPMHLRLCALPKRWFTKQVTKWQLLWSNNHPLPRLPAPWLPEKSSFANCFPTDSNLSELKCSRKAFNTMHLCWCEVPTASQINLWRWASLLPTNLPQRLKCAAFPHQRKTKNFLRGGCFFSCLFLLRQTAGNCSEQFHSLIGCFTHCLDFNLTQFDPEQHESKDLLCWAKLAISFVLSCVLFFVVVFIWF